MDQEFFPILEIAMTLYNMNQGMKRFSQSGVSAIEKEVCQLVTMDTLKPDNQKELSREDLRAQRRNGKSPSSPEDVAME